MAHGKSNGHMSDDTRDLENGWRCYLATIPSEAVWSAILATTWLFVMLPTIIT